MLRTASTLLLVLLTTMAPSWADTSPGTTPVTELPPEAPLAPGLTFENETTIKSPVNFLTVRPALNADGTANVVVEIPTGTHAKWEVKPDGTLCWDKKDGVPRIVNYLAYLGNYGMMPGTLQGDGDPIDILVLAPAYPRGSVVSAQVIGVLLFTDDGEQDNKLLAVVPGLPLGDVTSLEDLDERFPDVSHLVQTWFERYKGAGKEMIFKGREDRDQAMELIHEAVAKFAAEKKPAEAAAP